MKVLPQFTFDKAERIPVLIMGAFVGMVFFPSITQANITSYGFGISPEEVQIGSDATVLLEWFVVGDGTITCTMSGDLSGVWVDDNTDGNGRLNAVVSQPETNIVENLIYTIDCSDVDDSVQKTKAVMSLDLSCTLSGDHIIAPFPTGDSLRANGTEEESWSPEPPLLPLTVVDPPTGILPGIYRVELEGYNAGFGRGSEPPVDWQIAEIWKLRFLDGVGPGEDIDSATTTDLADDVDFEKRADLVNDNVSTPPVIIDEDATVTEVLAVHAAWNDPTPGYGDGANSVRPICAAVTLIEDYSCTLVQGSGAGEYDYVIPIKPALDHGLGPADKNWLLRSDQSIASERHLSDLIPSASFTPSGDISPGTYAVTLEAWDGHMASRDNPSAQLDEVFKLRFLGGGVGGVDIDSNSTTDLPDNSSDYFVKVAELVDNALVISNTVSEVQAVHADFPNVASPNSVKPICAGLDLNSAPTITVNPQVVTMTEGDSFNPLGGVTANDLQDGSIPTTSIIMGGDTVDSSTSPGNYTITYDVTDSTGLSAPQETRAVTVNIFVPPPPACSDGLDNDGDGFCDGPASTCTDASIPGDQSCYGDPDDSDTYNPAADPEGTCGDTVCKKGASENFLSCRIDCPINFFNF